MARQKQAVHSWEEALDAINGKITTYDGVECKIVSGRKYVKSVFYGDRFETIFRLEPTARGKRSEVYLADKQKLGDDYDIEPHDPENQVAIAEKFVKFSLPNS
jgi:hypothetical protein